MDSVLTNIFKMEISIDLAFYMQLFTLIVSAGMLCYSAKLYQLYLKILHICSYHNIKNGTFHAAI